MSAFRKLLASLALVVLAAGGVNARAAAQFDGTNYLGDALSAAETTPITILVYHFANDDPGTSWPGILYGNSTNYFGAQRNPGTVDTVDLAAEMRAGAGSTIRAAQVSNNAIGSWRTVVARFTDAQLSVTVDDGTPATNTPNGVPTTPINFGIGHRDGVEIMPAGDRVARVVLVDRDVTTQEVTDFDAGDWPPDIFGGDIIRFYDFPAGGGFLQDYQGNNDLTETGAGSITHVADPPGLSYGAAGGSAAVLRRRHN